MDPAPAWLDGDDQDTWQSLLTIMIALPAVLDRQLQRDAGMSNFEYGVLARLSTARNLTARLSELSLGCNSTLPRLSKLMDRFEARGWIVRRPDPDDGRYTLATLTETGLHQLVESAPGLVAQVKRLVFDQLTPAQRRQLRPALGRIAAAVHREFATG